MKAQLEMLAAYNAWVNERLYAAAAALPDALYRADRGAFFGSLHGTLNHLLAGDLIWLRRITGAGLLPERLDAVLHDDLATLHAARVAADERLIAYVAALTPEALAGTVRYHSTRNPMEIEQELLPLLIHVFNHQTHHRGQAHGILTALTGEAPSFDLLMYQRETGISLVRGSGGCFAATERRPAAPG